MHSVQSYRRVEVCFHSILTSTLVRVSDQLHVPVALSRGKNSVLPREKEAGLVPDLDWTIWRRGVFFPVSNCATIPGSTST